MRAVAEAEDARIAALSNPAAEGSTRDGHGAADSSRELTSAASKLDSILQGLAAAAEAEEALWAPLNGPSIGRPQVQRFVSECRELKAAARQAADDVTGMRSPTPATISVSLEHRLLRLQQSLAEAASSDLEAVMKSALAPVESLESVAESRLELLNAANSPDSAIPRRQIAAQRTANQDEALSNLGRLSAAAEAVEQYARDLHALGGLPVQAGMDFLALMREMRVTAAAASSAAVANARDGHSALENVGCIPRKDLEAWMADQRAQLAAFWLQAETQEAAETMSRLRAHRDAAELSETRAKEHQGPGRQAALAELERINRNRGDSLSGRLENSMGRASKAQRLVQDLLRQGMGNGLELGSLTERCSAVLESLRTPQARNRSDDELEQGRLALEPEELAEEHQCSLMLALEEAVSVSLQRLQGMEELSGKAGAAEVLELEGGAIRKQAAGVRRLLGTMQFFMPPAAATGSAMTEARRLVATRYRSVLSELDNAVSAAVQGKGGGRLAMELQGKVSGIQRDWLQGRMENAMSKASAAAEHAEALKRRKHENQDIRSPVSGSVGSALILSAFAAFYIP